MTASQRRREIALMVRQLGQIVVSHDQYSNPGRYETVLVGGTTFVGASQATHAFLSGAFAIVNWYNYVADKVDREAAAAKTEEDEKVEEEEQG